MNIYNFLKNDEWRCEKKFFISCATRQEVETIVKLHPVMFRKLFYERKVNNLYFDTLGMNFYNDNVVGTSQRVKVRIRWYGETFGRIEKPVLEIKCRNGMLGGKKGFPLHSFDLNEKTGSEDFKSLFLGLPEEIASIKQCLLSLKCYSLNNYTRSYFLSVDGDFRATIDSNLRYYRFFYKGNTFLFKHDDSSHIVLELKYEEKDDQIADRITSGFPFRITKNSKYVRGFDSLMM